MGVSNWHSATCAFFQTVEKTGQSWGNSPHIGIQQNVRDSKAIHYAAFS
jgi:hypothetical protein